MRPILPASLTRLDDQQRRRAISLALVAVIHLLLLLMLLRLAPPFELRLPPEILKIVPLAPETPNQLQTHTVKAGAAHPKIRPIEQAPAASSPLIAAEKPPVAATPWVINPQIADFNLSRTPNPASQRPVAAPTDTAATDAKEDQEGEVVGTGPGGAQLWGWRGFQRPPTGAEIGPYWTNRKVSGWGSIACKTAPRFHIEDCEEMGETPGSGFARSLRQMAWQFLVIPPTLNGKPQIGVWINLCFEFSEDGIAPGKSDKKCTGGGRNLFGKKID